MRPIDYTRWSREELDELERCYQAGMRWRFIADRVSVVRGIERTRDACRVKAVRIGLTKGRPKGKAPFAGIQDDLHDMVILGYSTRQIADELGISQSTVCRRIARLSSSQQYSWRRTASERVAKGAARGWVKRRKAA